MTVGGVQLGGQRTGHVMELLTLFSFLKEVLWPPLKPFVLQPLPLFRHMVGTCLCLVSLPKDGPFLDLSAQQCYSQQFFTEKLVVAFHLLLVSFAVWMKRAQSGLCAPNTSENQAGSPAAIHNSLPSAAGQRAVTPGKVDARLQSNLEMILSINLPDALIYVLFVPNSAHEECLCY